MCRYIRNRYMKRERISSKGFDKLKSLTDDWNKRLEKSEETEDQKTMAMLARNNKLNSSADDEIVFMLKTPAGVLSFKPSNTDEYTHFVQVVVEMLLSFNSSNIDPMLKRAIRKALFDFENGDVDENDEDEEEFDSDELDFLGSALKVAKDEGIKAEEAQKYVTSLPKTEKLSLKILSTDEDNEKRVERALNKYADLPPPLLDKVIHAHQSFSLPFEKAAELYIALRIMDVMLTIKSTDDNKKPVTKQASAAKTKADRKGKRPASAIKRAKSLLTGNEKIDKLVGNITDER